MEELGSWVTVITPQAAPEDSFTGPEFGTLYQSKKGNISVCTACGSQKTISMDKLFGHPVLGVLVCESCFKFYHNGPFTKDEDGIDEQCRWCGQGGNLLMCDYCTNSFCNYCIKRNFSQSAFERIRDKPKWKCFVCNPKQLEEKVRECKKIIHLKDYNAVNQARPTTSSQDLLLHSLDEGNKRLDDLLAPMEAQSKTSALPRKHETLKNNINADHPSKRVTPITILREREKYVIQKSASGDEQTHSKKEKQWQSDPESKCTFSERRKEDKIFKRHTENNMNLANIPEMLNTAKGKGESAAAGPQNMHGISAGGLQSEAIPEVGNSVGDNYRLPENNMPNGLPMSPKLSSEGKSSDGNIPFTGSIPNGHLALSQQISDVENGDKSSIPKKLSGASKRVPVVRLGDDNVELSMVIPGSLPASPEVQNVGFHESIKDVVAPSEVVRKEGSSETKDVGEKGSLELQRPRRNVGKRTGERACPKTSTAADSSGEAASSGFPLLAAFRDKQNMDPNSKMKEAEDHLHNYLQIIKDLKSEQYSIECGTASDAAHSPSQYSRFKTVNMLLGKVRKASSKLLRMEHDLRLVKTQLGTYRDHAADSDMSCSSSEDELLSHDKRGNRKSRSLVEIFDRAVEEGKKISCKQPAVKYEIGATKQLSCDDKEPSVIETKDTVAVDEPSISRADNFSAAKENPAAEMDNSSLKIHEVLKFADSKLANFPVIMIEKLTEGKIAELSQRSKKEDDSDSDLDSTRSSLDTDSSKNMKPGSNDSADLDEDDLGPNFTSIYPKKKDGSLKSKKKYEKDSKKNRQLGKYEEDSDYEIEGEYLTDSDPSDDHQDIMDDLDLEDVDDNEIAKNLLLQKMQEQDAETTDSDVEDLIGKQGEIGEKDLSKKKCNTDPEDGSSANRNPSIHPLLRKRWRSKSDDEVDNDTDGKKGDKRVGNVKRKRGKKSSENAEKTIDASKSDPDLTTDSECDMPVKKRKNTDVKPKRKILDSDSEEDHVSVVLVESDKETSYHIDNNANLSEVSTEGSDSDLEDVKKPARKRRRRLVGNSNSEEEVKLKQEDTENELDTPRKGGRKNIRKILDDDEVSQSTQMASIHEKRRRKQLEAEREAEEEKKEVIIIDEDNNTEIKKTITVGLTLSKNPLVKVHSHIVKHLKPHQIEGIQFLWDNIIEKVDDTNTKKGNGCILAHCMGLGKTLQTVALLHTVLMTKHLPKLRTVLVLCPFGTINNWVSEFKKWIPKTESSLDYKFRRLPIMDLNTARNDFDRCSRLQTWHERGGVMVIGYGLFRSVLRDRKRHHLPKSEETFGKYLLSPGPGILVCDEGHILKNAVSRIAMIVEKVATKRRIILTGTPLQNNMMEYHCMVSIVKPRLLGTIKEFKNRFVNPIENGQHVDSTEIDVKLMKRRAHVLHELLAGCVQRKDFTCLREHLAPKCEYTIKVRLSDLQIRLYEKYLSMQKTTDAKTKKACLFKDFQKLLVLVCHPRCLVMAKERQNMKENPRDDDETAESDDEDTSSDDSVIMLSDDDAPSQVPKPATLEDVHALSGWKLRLFIKEKSGEKPQTRNRKKLVSLAAKYLDENFCKTVEFEETLKAKSISQLKAVIAEHGGSISGCTEKSDLVNLVKSLVLKETQADEEWYEKFMPTQEKLYLDNKHGGKIMIMLEILQGAVKLGDKVVIFSQSLLTLDLIEDVLKAEMKAMAKGQKPATEPYAKWCKNKDYFRLDGSTPGNLRDLWISKFNDNGCPRGRLFLISTRAGGIGINLVGANRAIVFDASWNPSHDIQSIFRIYRFGQTKPCYIYRLIAQGTMEEKIYERQVVKRSLAYRVIDEQQVSRHFTAADIAELYKFNPAPKPDKIKRVPDGAPPRDALIASILMSTDLIVSYHEPDSLLDHQVSEELTEAERRAAWEEYDTENSSSSKTAVSSTLARFLNSLDNGALFQLIQKSDEALQQIQQKIGFIVSEPYDVTMMKIFMKNRSLTIGEVSQRASRLKLDRHILLRRLNVLKKVFTEYTAEARRCYQLRRVALAAAPSLGAPGPANVFPRYAPAPVTAASYQRPPRPMAPGQRSARPGTYQHSTSASNLPPQKGPRLTPQPRARPAGPQYYSRPGPRPTQQRPPMRHPQASFRPASSASSGAAFRQDYRFRTNTNARNMPGQIPMYRNFTTPQPHR